MKSSPAGIRHYDLACLECGARQSDDGLTLECTEAHGPALLQTEYLAQDFRPCHDDDGLFRYRNWLPVTRMREGIGRTAVYRSEGLARHLGLPNLWIAFNGYWPERGAFLQTGTFKELEAYTVLGRMPHDAAILTVASSGNTGAAFAWACSRERVPCLIVVPRTALGRLRFAEPLEACVQLVAVDDGDYPDAIAFAAQMSQSPLFQLEGGVKNVGRRDGLATVLLAAFEEMSRLPTHYFQAVGSGTGAIAVHEAAKRLQGAAAVDGPLPRLMLCQNEPFTPIYEAWRRGRRSVPGGPADHFRQAIRQVCADELTNWAPPFSITGGVYDALTESGGTVLVADNKSVQSAREMFQELEGTDIEPAAGVALACLQQAAAEGTVGRDAVVLLNVTGGGRARARQDHSLQPALPRLHLTRDSFTLRQTADQVAALCASAVSAA